MNYPTIKELPFPNYPLSQEKTIELTKDYPTPFHIYDENLIRKNARGLYDAFSWVEDFKNYFAVKALPNPFILKILKDEGMGTDCSSLPELILSERTGLKNEDMMFTSNDTPPEEFVKAKELGATINLDDIKHINNLESSAGIPELICFRYNPGPLKKGNGIIGNPIESKYGLTKDQLFDAYRMIRQKGVRRFGLHTMVVSNMLDVDYLIDTAKMLFELVVEIKKHLNIIIEFVNLGGGIGIPYTLDEKPVDYYEFSKGVREHYDNIIIPNNLHPLRIVMESGRAVTGPYGWLITKVRHVTKKYKNFVGLDSCMTDLMRPALYGAYHHISVLGKEHAAPDHLYDVTGSLCENNDKFAIDRMLPVIEEGDSLVIYNTGAHAHAMGFNYNGKLRSRELLLRSDGTVIEIRRVETIDDYFGTLDFHKLNEFKV